MSIRNVFDKIVSFENLVNAEKDIASGKRYESEVLAYRRLFEDNIISLKERLLILDMPPTHYYTFLVYEPKIRIVIYTDYTSKLTQRAIYNVINPLVCKRFITDTYACIEGRGQLSAMQRLYSWFQIQTRTNEKWYYYKFDVRKFFYRIDHDVLIGICEKMIGDKYAMELIRYYVCSKSRAFGMPLDGDHLTITQEEMLWDKGIAIGGGLSHMLGNMYLDVLDQYAKRVLRIKKYIRYMDDIIIVHTDKDRLKMYGDKLSDFLNKELLLEFNDKTALRPVNCGCEFVGYNVFPNHVNLRKQTSLRMKRKLKYVAKKYKNYEMSFYRANSTVQSYKALLKHGDNKRLEKKYGKILY